ncbi:MAG: hypothetical protein Q9227_000944 [Pyrenula ochraceoflavens]
MAQIDFSLLRPMTSKVTSPFMKRVKSSPVTEIYHSRNVKKSRAYLGLLSGPPNVHNAIDKRLNQSKRKVIRQGLTEESIRLFEPKILQRANEWVTNLSEIQRDHWTEPINVADSCKYLMFDTMSEVCFSQSFDLLNNPKHRHMISAISPLHRFNSAFVQSIDLARYHLEKIFCPRGIWYGWKFLSLARQFVEQKISFHGYPKHDLVSTISTSYSEKNKRLPLVEVWSEVKFLMVAGSGSPASALAASLFYITRNLSCYNRLVAEVRTTFPKASDIHSGARMSSCTYLHACVIEAMRMSPPFASVPWREVEEPGITIRGDENPCDNYFVAAGYDVGVGTYAVHHNVAYFPNPFIFLPERWLSSEAEILNTDVALAKRAFAAFSMGPRACLGQHLALMEVKNTLALLLWRCDLRVGKGAAVGRRGFGLIQEESADEFLQKDHMVSVFDGPWLQVRERHTSGN